MIYQGVHADNFKDTQGVAINHGSDNLQTRLGFKTYLDIPSKAGSILTYSPYLALNYIHNTNPYSVNINNVEYTDQGSNNLGEIKLGIEGHITQKNQLWISASYVAGSHNNQTYLGNLGWKYNF